MTSTFNFSVCLTKDPYVDATSDFSGTRYFFIGREVSAQGWSKDHRVPLFIGRGPRGGFSLYFNSSDVGQMHWIILWRFNRYVCASKGFQYCGMELGQWFITVNDRGLSVYAFIIRV